MNLLKSSHGKEFPLWLYRNAERQLLTHVVSLINWRQGWQGRGVARVAGRQNVATPAGSRVAKEMTGSLFESKNHHSHHNIRLEH